MMYKDTDCLHNMEQEQTTFLGESSTFFSVKEKEKCNNQTVTFIQLSNQS